jgi:site-specific DNA recombinase
MQVAVYARVSTQRQAQAQTTDQQLGRLRAHTEQQGWFLPPERVFRDDGHRGAGLKRPGLDRLRDAAAGARLDRILITAPDRLARNYVHQVLLVEALQKHGAEVAFLDRPMSRDPHDRLLLQIRGAVAEYERTLTTERMRRGRLRKLRAGTLLPWTRPPYGYRLDPERPRDPAGVRLDEAEAAMVRDLFAWFADEGATVLGLVQRLDRLGVAAAQGSPSLEPLGPARPADQPRPPRPSLGQPPAHASGRAAPLGIAATRARQGSQAGRGPGRMDCGRPRARHRPTWAVRLRARAAGL